MTEISELDARACTRARTASPAPPRAAGATVAGRAAAALAGACLAGLATAPAALAATDLNTVIGNLQLWLSGLLASFATVFLIVGGCRYVMAGGDPVRLERAKSAITSAALGYAFALLAPVVITIIQQIVG